ncbi:MAG TPA: thermonuclease family protein [Gallionella sp.]|nr:thermonuclease family protein [Gallionella sp.]
MVLLFTCNPAVAQEFSAEVIAVIDGDTVLVRRGTRPPEKIRLAEIDAPEKDQTFGETSRRSLSDLVLHKDVRVTTQAVDDYGRLVAHLSVATSAGRLDVNTEQIRRGMAWEYSHFHRNRALVELQNEARRAPRGLWAQSKPVPPWEWRKLHPHTVTASAAHAAPRSAEPPASSCGPKRHCAEMTSCEEAKHYFTQCGIKALDGNGDGVPCANLCAPSGRKPHV